MNGVLAVLMRHVAVLIAAAFVWTAPISAADPPLPELTGPVNDFAHVIDARAPPRSIA